MVNKDYQYSRLWSGGWSLLFNAIGEDNWSRIGSNRMCYVSASVCRLWRITELVVAVIDRILAPCVGRSAPRSAVGADHVTSSASSSSGTALSPPQPSTGGPLLRTEKRGATVEDANLPHICLRLTPYRPITSKKICFVITN